MAFIRGANVVTNGLVLALDAANPKSYVSGSLDWRDLSGTNLTGSLINGPTFSSVNGGSIVFDGTNDYIDCGDNDIFTPSKISIVCWINRTNSTRSRVVSKDSGGANRDYGLQLTDTGGFIFFLWRENGNSGISSEYSLPSGWNNIGATWDGSNIKLYLNSIEVVNTAFAGTSIRNTTAPLWIGRYLGASDEIFKGNIATVQIYNRALSAAEVLQNYNATKARFNLD